MQKKLSLFLVIAIAIAMFSVSGVAFAQDPPADADGGDTIDVAQDDGTVTETNAITTTETTDGTVTQTDATTTTETTDGTVTQTDSVTDTIEPTAEPTPVVTPTETITPTAEPTPVVTPTETITPTAEPTPVVTPTETITPTAEPTPVVTPTETITPTAEPTPVVTPPVINSFTANPAALTIEAGGTISTTLSWDVTGAVTLALNAEDVTGLTEKTVDVTETTTYTLTATGDAGSVDQSIMVAVKESVVEVGVGEIETEAITGNWSTEAIYVQNLGTSATNQVSLQLYDDTGGTVGGPISSPVFKDGAASFGISSFSDGQYSGVVSSAEPVVAAVANTNQTGTVGDMYDGIDNPGQTQIVPIIYRGHSFWSSSFYIQNAHSAAQDVQIKAYYKGEDTPRAAPTYNIPAYSSRTIDFMNSDFDAFGTGFGAFGYAEIVGKDGPVAVISSAIKDQAGFPIEAMVAGVDPNSASNEVLLPLIYNGHSIWITGISVVNLTNISTTVDYTYSIAPQYGGGTQSFSRPLASNGNDGFSLAIIPSLLNPSFGSIKLKAQDPNAKIIAIANHSKYQSGLAVGSINPSVDPLVATNKVAIPFGEYNSGLVSGDVPGTGLGWQTGLVVYNVGHSGNITTKWVKVDTDPSGTGNTTTYSTAGTIDGLTNLTVVSPALKDVIPKGFKGVVYIESSGPIVAIANQTLYSKSISAIVSGKNY